MDGKDGILFLRRGRLESRVTYASFRRTSDRVAGGLVGMGLKKGERIVLLMPKSVEQAVIHLGIQKVGAISVILNPGFKRDEIEYFVKDSDASLLIVGRKEEALIRSIDEKTHPSDRTEAPLWRKIIPWNFSFHPILMKSR
jgi:acyl-coenzyme A synthetase/AMP-(fatty) acid ligase